MGSLRSRFLLVATVTSVVLFAVISCTSDQFNALQRLLCGVGGFDLNTFAVGGPGGEMFFTDDGGSGFSTAETNTNKTITSIFFGNDDSSDSDSNPNLWATGKGGLLLKGADLGLNWNPVSVGSGVNLLDVDFPSNQIGFAVGEEGTVIRTTDGGANFDRLQFGASPNFSNFNSVKCFDINVCWTVGSGGAIYKTVDGFNTVRHEESGTTNDLLDVFVFDANTVWAVGNMGTMTYTTNGGDNWEVHNFGLTVDFTGVFFKDRLNGIIIGDNFLGRTNDGGETLSDISANLPTDLSSTFKALRFFGDSGIIVGSNNTAIGTTNFGDTFFQYSIPTFATPEPTQVPIGTPDFEPTVEPTAIPSATEGPGTSPTQVPTNAPTSVPPTSTPDTSGTQIPDDPGTDSGCEGLLSGTYSGSGGCNISTANLGTPSSSSVTITPFGANSSATFSGGSGERWTSTSGDLILFGLRGHICSIECTPASYFVLRCSNSDGGSCSETFNR